jgi:hypothetical protein
MAEVFAAAEAEIAASDDTDEPDQLRERARNISEFASALERMSNFPRFGREAYEHSEKLAERAEELKQAASELDPPEPDYDDYSEHRSSSPEAFDVHALFAEL